METPDTSISGDNGPEGVLIGGRLQELAEATGMNQRQLALRVGIDPRHFNSLWHDKKAAGLPLIRKIGQRAGRSIAWLCGEEAARPLIGTANALGQVTMTTDNTPISQGIIHFIDGAGAFAPGERVLVDPSDRWAEGHWLLVRPRAGGEAWVGWARMRGDMQLLERADGEVIAYADDRHEIVGVIVGTIAPPPKPASALR